MEKVKFKSRRSKDNPARREIVSSFMCFYENFKKMGRHFTTRARGGMVPHFYTASYEVIVNWPQEKSSD